MAMYSATSATSTAAPIWRGSVRWRPSDEPLWAKWDQSAQLLRELEALNLPPAQQRTLHELDYYLASARECLENRRRWIATDALMFWRLMHCFDEDVIRLIPLKRLYARALEIKEQFDRNVSSSDTRAVWQDPFSSAVTRVHLASVRPTTAAVDDLAEEREVIRAVNAICNTQTDLGFRQFVMNMRIQIWSTMTLLGVVAVLIGIAYRYNWHISAHVSIWVVLALGAAGAVVSNMVSKSTFTVPHGQTFLSFTYYLLVIPVIGAIAAALIIALEESGMLFSVIARATAQSASDVVATPQGALSASGAPIVITVPEERMVTIVLILIAFAAGFAGDRIVRSAIESVLAKLNMAASKETPPAATPPQGNGLQ